MITDLREINPDVRLLLVSESKFFKGVSSHSKAVSYSEFR